jgi:signal transduction histidine kinase/ligand-binding sensor domain-containing protein
MYRAAILLLGLFTAAYTFAQQYPFVHYSPKDGLISNQVRSIYQDSKGRLYFNSINGLSVYDGSRFINYSSANGFESDIVNCVMEMGNDSIWIATNDSNIYYLVNNKLRKVVLKEQPPIIDNLVRDEKGTLYAASEQGLFVFQQNRFERLPFITMDGKDLNSLISNIYPAGRYLLVARDNSLVDAEEKNILYLYDKESRKITAQTKDVSILSVASAPDGRIWASTGRNIISLDTVELKKGKIIFRELPSLYDKIKKKSFAFISFDQYGNSWMTDKVEVLNRFSTDGKLISYTVASGLSNMDISHVFADKEGTAWIATFSGGVAKLAHSNFSSYPNAYGISAIGSIWYSAEKDHVLLYSPVSSKAVIAAENKEARIYDVKESASFQLFETTKGIFGTSGAELYKLHISGNSMYPEIMVPSSTGYHFNNPIIDRNNNFIVCGKNFITAVLDGGRMSHKRTNDFTDHATLDTSGNIWVATRTGKVIKMQPDPTDAVNYLAKENIIATLDHISPRSIAIDKNNMIWIGTRSDGIHVFKEEGAHLRPQFQLHSSMGLSDNFITQIVVSPDNNIWACSASGLDKITMRNGTPVVENITRQNNIYQRVINIVIDNDNTVWGHLANGLIKITNETRHTGNYTPSLFISMVRSGRDTISGNSSLSYKQNDLSFYFAATSFLDEKQVLYSYRLEGGSNTQWSEPSNNASVSFIGLNPGDYTLYIKANFPAARYPEQMMQYTFSIAPPWWQTWWFKAAIAILSIIAIATIIRFYYRRKLQKQKLVLEKQQAIEKERTRIATDMHDDLGAGLSRIKFLSQSLANKKIKDEHTRTSLEKITGYSDEMAEKMGEIVWALNEKNDTLADLIAYTRSYTMEYLANHGIQCEANTPLQLKETFIPGETRRNIFLSVKECLHNIVKHAGAGMVNFSIELDKDIRIIIHDNGKGIDWNNKRINSNGLGNIHKRMKEIDGKAQFLDQGGTKVILDIPLPV